MLLAPAARRKSSAGSKKPSKRPARAAPEELAFGGWRPLPRDVAWVALAGVALVLAMYMKHCVFVAGEMYSAPSVVMQTRRPDGGIKVFDDFREAYSWLAHNTDPDAKVASWWDYGYQTTAMANRTGARARARALGGQRAPASCGASRPHHPCPLPHAHPDRPRAQ